MMDLDKQKFWLTKIIYFMISTFNSQETMFITTMNLIWIPSGSKMHQSH
jgi:hypothetical protein